MRKITVAMVLFPGFQLLDIAGPKDAFAEVRILSHGECEYEMLTVGTTRGSVQSSSGLTVVPDRTIFDPCPQFDTVIIPGGLGIFEVLEDSTLSEWLVRQRRLSRRIAAICNGVFAFGAAGMIDNRTVTTHWMDAARLATMFPKANVERDQIYVKDEGIYTTAGVTAGIDLALVMIEEDFGKKMALDVAKYLIVYVRRAGGQSQFSPLLETQGTADSQIQPVRQYLLDNLHLPHTMTSLAERLNMSARNLSRVFSKECGVSLIAFLNDARIDAARRYLESTDHAVSVIARRCGFENADTLRRTFSKRLHISPMEYRQRFRSNDLGNAESGSKRDRVSEKV
ncbi:MULTISPECIES: GlxA family transcriptional regulator [Burkholderiaceae]|uniref:Transcriptional regulator containing an amidase domain and an AraC-type DNA-binding HTH domain n=1 Tax=Caballeronia sordidicola TaxID=196367 RepID=A0A242MMY8_CABSO|nr:MULTISPECIES: GlxA family transcriptional regulator [Burkholderiaceae]AME25921.1 AraC family transcriptional regulator [Burkholderia sp. PAMC 26561]OTP72687.1 Transcriptional regulator containing an amidase domain and an AraC-type DNA-binding HTH domain [Caballeronia sordidicola]